MVSLKILSENLKLSMSKNKLERTLQKSFIASNFSFSPKAITNL